MFLRKTDIIDITTVKRMYSMYDFDTIPPGLLATNALWTVKSADNDLTKYLPLTH